MRPALNDLKVKVRYVLNAYITAPITEKIWTVFQPKTGSDASTSDIMVRKLYGLAKPRAFTEVNEKDIN